jgi:hypothetical protein
MNDISKFDKSLYPLNYALFDAAKPFLSLLDQISASVFRNTLHPPVDQAKTFPDALNNTISLHKRAQNLIYWNRFQDFIRLLEEEVQLNDVELQDFIRLLEEVQLNDVERRALLKGIILKQPQWLELLTSQKDWQDVVNSSMVYLSSYKCNHDQFKIICDRYHPTKEEFKKFLKNYYLSSEIALTVMASQSSKSFFSDVINDQDTAYLLLKRVYPLNFYKALHQLGWNSHNFNIPFDDFQHTLIHVLIRDGDITFVKRLLKDIPKEDIYLGKHFYPEDFESCIAESTVPQSHYAIAQSGCNTIAQDSVNEEMPTIFPGANIEMKHILSTSDSFKEGGLVKIYLNRNHASLSLQHTTDPYPIHYGFYPSEDVPSPLHHVNCAVIDDKINAIESE